MAKSVLQTPSSSPACWSYCRHLFEVPENTSHALSPGSESALVNNGIGRWWGFLSSAMPLSEEKDEPVLSRGTDRQSSHPQNKPDLINTVSFNLKCLFIWQIYLQNEHSVFEHQQRQRDWGLEGFGAFFVKSGLWKPLRGQSSFICCCFTYGPERWDFQWELQPFVFRDCPAG